MLFRLPGGLGLNRENHLFGHARKPTRPELKGKVDEPFSAFGTQKRTHIVPKEIPARIIIARAECRGKVGFERIGENLLVLDAGLDSGAIVLRSERRPEAVRPGEM